MSITINATRLPRLQYAIEKASVVVLDDAKKRPAKEVVVDINPVQDLHGYSNPWPAGGGINAMPNAVAKTETQNGVTISTNGDGIYTLSGTASDYVSITFPLSVSFVIPSGNADTGTHSVYFMNTDINSSGVTFCFMNNSTQVDSWAMIPKNRSAASYKAMSNKTCNKVRFIVNSGVSVSGTISPMFAVKGTPTSTAFAPYSNICPISGRSEVNVYVEETYDAQATPKVTLQLGQTVYGGTVDLVSGVLSVTHKTIVADGINLKVEGIYANGTAYTGNIDDIYNDSSYAHQRDIMVLCDKLKGNSFINISSNTYAVAQSGGKRIVFNIPDCTTNAEFNSWLQTNTPTIYYLLAEPLTYQLTPQQIQTLQGNNTVWSDAGDTQVTYAAIRS